MHALVADLAGRERQLAQESSEQGASTQIGSMSFMRCRIIHLISQTLLLQLADLYILVSHHFRFCCEKRLGSAHGLGAEKDKENEVTKREQWRVRRKLCEYGISGTQG